MNVRTKASTPLMYDAFKLPIFFVTAYIPFQHDLPRNKQLEEQWGLATMSTLFLCLISIRHGNHGHDRHSRGIAW